jgi:hypothetical protein
MSREVAALHQGREAVVAVGAVVSVAAVCPISARDAVGPVRARGALAGHVEGEQGEGHQANQGVLAHL